MEILSVSETLCPASKNFWFFRSFQLCSLDLSLSAFGSPLPKLCLNLQNHSWLLCNTSQAWPPRPRSPEDPYTHTVDDSDTSSGEKDVRSSFSNGMTFYAEREHLGRWEEDVWTPREQKRGEGRAIPAPMTSSIFTKDTSISLANSRTASLGSS